MSKTVQPSKLTEWKGLDRISVIVHQMGNIWREMTKDDFGLDGEIEVATPKANGEGFETAGGIVKVQSKAGESYVRYDSDTSFSTPHDRPDVLRHSLLRALRRRGDSAVGQFIRRTRPNMLYTMPLLTLPERPRWPVA